MTGIELPTQLLIVYLLLHLRFIGLISGSPLFTTTMAPTPFRYLFATLLTAAAAASIGEQDIPLLLFDGPLSIALVGARELLIGLALGFLSSLTLIAVRVAGEQIGTTMGFSMAQVMDPTMQTQDSILGQLHFFVALWSWFRWNGHLLLIHAAVESLGLAPLGRLSFLPTGDVGAGAWLQGLFTLAMRVAIPFYCALVLADIGLGFLARTVPQMNIFVLGLPIKVALGFLVLTVALPLMVDLVFGQFERWIGTALETTLLWRAGP
ncbi:MAG: flagellar biosynthetic protein FliR [Synergistaceae bacterium]|nr:flagellar biosynthetic protein FliR [Synergistaceae bacterium]